MPHSAFVVTAEADAIDRGLAAIRREQDVPEEFPTEVIEAAVAAAARGPVACDRADRRDLPFVTIDPPGAADLDQALCIEPAGDGGHIVWYAIADVAAFVEPGDALDVEARRRGSTLYAPDRKTPLHPPVLSEGAASLLPGVERPAVLWRLRLDPSGSLVDTDVGRAMVRSTERLTYVDAQERIDDGDPALGALAVVGRRRLAIEASRGGSSLPIPEQEITSVAGGYDLGYRTGPPVEGWNAQVSLLCGMAAADLMLSGGWGLLRTLPPATPHALDTLRRSALALGVPWPAGQTYGDVVRSVRGRREPAVAAFFVQATRLFRGAGYLALTPGMDLDDHVIVHGAIAAPYAHVTAPLRRLGDRHATEIVLALVRGEQPPAWLRDVLADIPGEVAGGASRASALERAVVDLVEAAVLESRVGAVLQGVVVDHRRSGSSVQVQEPAVVVWVGSTQPLGSVVRLRVDAVDLGERRVDLTVVE